MKSIEPNTRMNNCPTTSVFYDSLSRLLIARFSKIKIRSKFYYLRTVVTALQIIFYETGVFSIIIIITI